jgi:hypothetical protein
MLQLIGPALDIQRFELDCQRPALRVPRGLRANSTPHADAGAATVPCKIHRARAGGRER